MNASRLMLAAKVLGALAALMFIIMWMSGFFAPKIPPGLLPDTRPSAPPGAATAIVSEVTRPVVEEAAGTVQAERKTGVSSQILAVIREITVRAGDTVQQGDIVIRLDDRELIARMQEARRAVDAAEAAQQRYGNDLQRAHQLRRDGIISQSEIDQTDAAFKIADAELERARESLRAAQVALTYAEIVSPVEGRVVDRYADPGDTAVPGRPLLALYDPTALRMEVPVRESLATQLRLGDTLEVRVGSTEERLQGVVDEIVPQAEVGSRTFLVKVGLPKRDDVYTGMFGRVIIPAGSRTRLLVPVESIERVGQLAFVTVVGPERQLSRRLITLGAAGDDPLIEVLSGLQAGEVVLLAR